MKKTFKFFLLSLFCGLFLSKPYLGSKEPTAVRIPPVLWYESDPDDQRKFLMALLLYWQGRDRSGQFNLLAPLYYGSKSGDEKLRVLLPFHFHYSLKDSETNLWGLYFSKKSLKSQTRFLFPLYYNSTSEETGLTVLGPYFSQRNQRYSTKFVLPLFWSYVPNDVQLNSYQFLIPFYLKIRSQDSRSIFSPLFWSYRDKDVSHGFIPPYLWYKTADKRAGVGFPLYWRFYKKKKDDFKDIEVAVPWFRISSKLSSFSSFFPLYWGQSKQVENPAGSGNFKKKKWGLLLPLYYGTWRPDGSSRVITLLYSRFKDKDGKTFGHSGLSYFSRDVWGGKTEGLFPFMYYREEPDYFKFTFFNLSIKKDKTGQHVRSSVFPLYRYKRDSDRKQLLTPLFYVDRDPEISRGFILNYLWKTQKVFVDQNSDEVNHKRVFFPLLWHIHHNETSTTAFPPLAAFHKHPGYKISVVLPMYFRRTKGEDTLTVIPPFITRKSPEKNWISFFFLFWRSSIKGKDSISIFPFYRRSKSKEGYSLLLPGFYYDKEGGRTQGFVLPYFWDHRGKTQYDIVPPLYVRFKRPSWELKTVFPIYKIEGSRIREKGFFPLWAVTKPQSSTTTPKHYLADSHRLLPFYFYRRLDPGYDLWMPILLARFEKKLGHDKQEMKRGRLFLLGSWEKTHDRLIHRFDPLYSYVRTPESKGFSAPTAPFPLWRYEVTGRSSEKTKKIQGAVFPYFWKQTYWSRRDVIFPIYFRGIEKRGEPPKEVARLTWALLYYATKTDQGKSNKIFFPIFWRFVDKESRLTVFPPFWFSSGKEYKRNIVFPLWWQFEKNNQKSKFLFPLFFRSHNKPEGRSSLILPLYWHSIDPESTSRLVGLYYSRRDDSIGLKSKLLFPLFGTSRSKNKSSQFVFPIYWKFKNDARTLSTFFPLYFRHKRENLDWLITFPIFWRVETQGQIAKVLPPFFSVYSKKTQTKTSGLAFIYTYSRNKPQDRAHFQFLGGLFAYKREAEKKQFTLLYFIKI